MPHFKDPQNGLHYLDDAAFAYLLPEGCVEISAAEAARLQEPSVGDAKARAWENIKGERDRRRFDGGVKVGGHWYLSTAVATSEYTALMLLSAGQPDNTVLRAGWRTMDGAKVDMTPLLVRQILAAGFAAVAAIDDAALAHKAAMEASPTPATYNYSAGWPAIFGD